MNDEYSLKRREPEGFRRQLIGRIKTLGQPLDDVYNGALTLLQQASGASYSLVVLLEQDGRWQHSMADFNPQEISQIETFCDAISQDEELLVISDADESAIAKPGVKDALPEDNKLRLMVGAPVVVDEEVVGVLAVLDRKPKAVSGTFLDAIKAMARQVSLILELRLRSNDSASIPPSTSLEGDLTTEIESHDSPFSTGFDRVFDTLPIGCTVLDMSGKIIAWNLENERIYGHRAVDVIGRTFERSLIDYSVLPDPVFDEIAHSHEPIRRHERCVHRADGTDVIVIASTTPLFDESGEPVGVVRTSFDISNRKANERRFTEFAVELASKTAQLTESIRRHEASERFVRTIADSAPGLIAYWDCDLKCRFANQAYQEWFGKTPAEMVGMSLSDLLGEALYAKNEPYIIGVLAGKAQQFERTLVKPNGEIGYTLAHYIPDVGRDGKVQGFSVLVSDVTKLQNTETELSLAASVFENIVEGIMVTDARGTILSVNPAFTAITGYRPDEAIGQLPRILRSDHHSPEFYQRLWSELLTKGRWEGEIWNRRRDGSVYLQMQTISAICNSHGEPVRFISVLRDGTERWREDERLRWSALHDHITELPNRHLLHERVFQLISQAEREDRRIALLFCDLDGFKTVNDRYGHAAGDEILKSVARVFVSQVRQSDTVSRIGGDEFVILLDNPVEQYDEDRVAKRLVEAVSGLAKMDDIARSLGVSIGIAVYPEHGLTPEELLRAADAAMYRAKSRGKNHHERYDFEDRMSVN